MSSGATFVPHTSAPIRPNASLHLGEPVIHDRLVAVQRRSHQPPADIEPARQLVEDVIGNRPAPRSTTPRAS